ncbi:hypothetical protein [Fundidesulfovibrio soli]|uniref:hypothetical protein n=1 Tax=Fundidesulfovibrio soli TaxID=2922716 RepID=UPI001FAF3D50|nr:hypothetical protein [Fundidesulfovibrio soli]
MNAKHLFACAAVLLALPLLCVNARAAGQQSNEPVNTQGLSRQGEVYERHVKNPQEEKWKFPTAGPQTEFRSDQVYQAFPQTGAVFRQGMEITLGWHPAGTDPSAVARYEVSVDREGGLRETLRPGLSAEGKTNTAIYQARQPGRYVWQVWAYMRNGLIIPSVLRTFVVLK